MQFPQCLGLLIPTLLLCSSLFWSTLGKAPIYSESFANNGNYITLQFPNHSLKVDTFQGTWTTDKGERQVVGLRKSGQKNRQYIMELPEGRFVGVLEKVSKGCEPVLKFTVERNGALVKRGQMKAAFCL